MTAVGRVAGGLARLVRTATRPGNRRPRGSADAQPAWDAWHAGDFQVAREHAAALLEAGQAVDEARHLVALVACVLGEYDEAIATHQLIDTRYRRLAELDEPVLWAFVHRDDVAGALAFAERRGIGRRGAVTQRLRLALENPLDVEIEGVVDVPFTDDALTPLMPGFSAHLNGRSTVARLDTGGSNVHMTAEAAEAYGVKAVLSAENEDARTMGTSLVACMLATLFFIAAAGYEMMTYILCGLLVSYWAAFAPKMSVRATRFGKPSLGSAAGVSERS